MSTERVRKKSITFHSRDKSGQKKKWTVKELENLLHSTSTDAHLKPQHGDHFADGGGLRGKLNISATGEKTINWMFSFKLNGKSGSYNCGTYPDTSLADIRAQRDAARLKVREGVHPAEANRAERIRRQQKIKKALAADAQEKAEKATVHDLFSSWIAEGVARKDGNKDLIRRFQKDVIPVVGKTKLKEIESTDVVFLLLEVKKRGHADDPQRNMNRSIEALYNDLKQMFRWAQRRKAWRALLVESGNPCDEIELEKVPNLIDFDYTEFRDRVLSDHEIRELSRALARLEDDYAALPAGKKYSSTRPVQKTSQIALWLCLSTICRIGELLMAEWVHVDFAQRTWFIPAVNTKSKKGRSQDLTVHLSDFALQQFRMLCAITGDTPFCFPNRYKNNHVCLKSVSKMVGDRQAQFKKRTKSLSKRTQDNSLVLSSGRQGAWTPHDLRRTGATLMQKLGVSLEIIDRCQNHVLDGAKTRRHYLHYDYQQEMKEAWDKLGAHLEAILYNDNVLTFNKKIG